MKKSLVLFVAMATTNAMTVNAAVIELFEGGVNIDGNVQVIPAISPEVDASLFNFTTGLGIIRYTITGIGEHHASLYVDHQIDEAINGFFNEFGSAGGLVTGQSWEIDDPFMGNIFFNFSDGNNTAGSQLDMSNGVPQGMENDVAMALAWDFTLGSGVGAGETAVVDFMVAEQKPTDGFFLSLTDSDTNHTIYFSSTFNLDIHPVPVPGALLLFGSGLVGLMGTCYRRKSKKAEV